MAQGTCSIEGCERYEQLRRGMCKPHYSRWRRTGDPGPPKIEQYIPDGKYTRCTYPGCDRPHHSKGYCYKHYVRVKKWGNPDGISVKGPAAMLLRPSYAGAHRRVAQLRGPASAHRCVDCGDTAREWSYRGGAAVELSEVRFGSLLAYSASPSDYDPRCKPCHARHDMG